MNGTTDSIVAEVTRRTLQVPKQDASLVIQTDLLGRRFGNHWAVNLLNLEVPRGSVYGFLGLNGAGKSTTIRMLMGLLSPTEGTASVLGLDPQRQDIEIKRRVGYVPDTPTFYEWMTIEETLAFVAHYRRKEWDNARALHLVKEFDLPLKQRVGTLSKGQRAKISLILAMAFNPELLLLDEPTLGLDPVARRQFVEGLLAEFLEGDRTVLISSHLIHEISGIVDHVGIMKQGQLIRSQRTEDLLAGLKRIRLQYETAPPPEVSMEGLVRYQVNGREAVLVIDGWNGVTAGPQLSQLGAIRYDLEDLSLEEAFVELAGRGEVL